MIDTLYERGDSPLHRFDCRLKLVMLPFFVIYYFFPLPPVCPGALLFLTAFLVVSVSGIADLLRPLKMIFPLLLLIILLTPLFNRGGDPLIIAGSLTILTRSGLIETIIYIIRFTGITLAFYLFFRTTPMEDMLLGLRWFRIPYVMTLVISVALRYIPHLTGLYSQISSAHSLRCSFDDPMEKTGFSGRIRRFFPILVSLMIQSVKTIPALSMALELKGVGRDQSRSQYRVLPNPARPAFQIIMGSLVLVLLCLTLLLWL